MDKDSPSHSKGPFWPNPQNCTIITEIFSGPFFAQMLQFEWEHKRGWKSESESKVPLKGESTIVENAPKSIIM